MDEMAWGPGSVVVTSAEIGVLVVGWAIERSSWWDALIRGHHYYRGPDGVSS